MNISHVLEYGDVKYGKTDASTLKLLNAVYHSALRCTKL